MNNVIQLKKYIPDQGDINFSTYEYGTILTLKSDGNIFVKGKLIENDKEIVNALRLFLIEVGYA